MNPWATFWHLVLWTSLVSFAALALWVTFGGLRDLAAMFRELDRERGEDSGSDRSARP